MMTVRRILTIGDNAERTDIIRDGVERAGHQWLGALPPDTDLRTEVARHEPDIIILDILAPVSGVTSRLLAAVREIRRPTVMFVEESDSRMAEAAVEAGVSVYVVAGLEARRVGALLDTAVSRHQFFEQLRSERDAARAALEDRKVIERAKGLLMQEKGLSEPDAYAAMRRSEMKSNRKLADIARGIITTFDLDV